MANAFFHNDVLGNAPFPRACTRYIPQSLPILIVVWGGNQSRKNAFPKSALPTAVLPKATLLFSLLLPEVRLLMEIPSCSSQALPLNSHLCSALILG